VTLALMLTPMRTPLFAIMALLGCTHSVPSPRPTPATSALSPRLPSDSMPVHDSFTVRSSTLGEARLINVHTPREYRTTNGASPRALPVLYMPDGGLDEDFPHVVRTVDSLIALGSIPPIIVVGVPNTQRRRDLTGPTRVHSDSAIAPRVGGSAAFRRFIAEELFPEIDRRYRTSGERAIIGESLAGLFIMETFLDEPALFTHYIALDPSLWWNKGALVDSAASRIAAMAPARRTLYFATSEEPGTYVGAGRIAESLRAVPPPGLRFTYEPRPDLTHGNIFHTLKARALVEAFR
jgi:predicted alpha/beta superfamily hydrolase